MLQFVCQGFPFRILPREDAEVGGVAVGRNPLFSVPVGGEDALLSLGGDIDDFEHFPYFLSRRGYPLSVIIV